MKLCEKNCLIVIPARGGSKGIPRKNIRMLNGKPLITYAIKNALSLKEMLETTVVVDTDDEEIAEVARQNGAYVVMRPEYLADDITPLDPVIYHALETSEAVNGRKYDIVITMQPTSPTLRGESIKDALNEFAREKCDTLLSVVNDSHLSWVLKGEDIVPNYEERKNRQYLPAEFRETGGFVISKRKYVTENSRLGSKIGVFVLKNDEAIDIDSEFDWILCEAVLKRKKILIRADGEEKLGMGHVYRALSLAYHLTGHNILLVTQNDMELGRKKIEASHFPLELINQNDDIFGIVERYKPDIVINDILDTSKEYMEKLKKAVPRIVNFEDQGDGAKYADAVINALYEEGAGKNFYCGFKYFFIRDEFLTAKPKEFSNEVKNIVILFGGSDPSNLTRKLYEILQKNDMSSPNIKYHFITGFGYAHKNEIKDDIEHGIYIHNDVKRVSDFLAKADMAITSQGRTIYELACMGVPSIVMAQNQRELEHKFAGFANGFINIGLGTDVDEDAICSTLRWLINTGSVRKEMHDLLLEKDFRTGQERVIRLILGE